MDWVTDSNHRHFTKNGFAVDLNFYAQSSNLNSLFVNSELAYIYVTNQPDLEVVIDLGSNKDIHGIQYYCVEPDSVSNGEYTDVQYKRDGESSFTQLEGAYHSGYGVLVNKLYQYNNININARYIKIILHDYYEKYIKINRVNVLFDDTVYANSFETNFDFNDYNKLCLESENDFTPTGLKSYINGIECSNEIMPNTKYNLFFNNGKIEVGWTGSVVFDVTLESAASQIDTDLILLDNKKYVFFVDSTSSNNQPIDIKNSNDEVIATTYFNYMSVGCEFVISNNMVANACIGTSYGGAYTTRKITNNNLTKIVLWTGNFVAGTRIFIVEV